MAFTTPWESMDALERQRQYSPSQWSTRFSPAEAIQDHIKNAEKGSLLARTTLDCQLGVEYGPGDEQKLDIFGMDSLPADAPIFAFIHGGYWQVMSLAQSSYMASCFVKAGAVVVSVGYDLCPKVTIPDIITQVKAATSKIIELAKKRGSRGIYFGGHSAGGQLATMMLSFDWGQDNHLLKGNAVLSGIFDLRPLLTTTVNEPLGMNNESAWEVSPARIIPDLIKQNLSAKRRFRFLVGDIDSEEFIRQSYEMSKAFSDAGVDSTCTVLKDTDHFTIVDNLQYPDYNVSKIIFDLMGLTCDGKAS